MDQLEVSKWHVKKGRPSRVPQESLRSGCETNCFTYECRLCMSLLALDYYNKGYRKKVEFIPRIGVLGKNWLGLFKNHSGYHGEIIDFYGAYLSQIKDLKGVAVNSWTSENARHFFQNVQETFEGDSVYGDSKNFEIDWILFNGNRITAIEVGRKNTSTHYTKTDESKSLDYAAVRSNLKSMIRKKTYQIIRYEKVVNKLLAATDCENIPVNYLLVFPNLPVEDLRNVFPPAKRKESLDRLVSTTSRLLVPLFSEKFKLVLKCLQY